MDYAKDNPDTNTLGAGLTEDQIRSAVDRSGYPLQIIVGDILRLKQVTAGRNFRVQEEWSYVDRDTKKLRSIDLLAELPLPDWNRHPRVRPYLDLLIECKQSKLPYIFFETIGAPSIGDFPTVAGLRSDKIVLTSDDDPSSWTFNVVATLGLADDPFQTSPRSCHTLSECVRKGADIELSGSDAYNGLVLPLVKAVQHFVRSQAPVDTAWYFDCHLTLAVAVLDAPMISMNVGPAGPVLTAVPWMRVLRHEYQEEADHFDREQLRVIEIVHRDFFETYLDKHLIPFANRFSERVLRHTTELATGVAFVPRMGAGWWKPIENRMRPRSPASFVSRTAAVGRNVLRFLQGKGQERDRCV